jgi:hypothetical protein
VHPDGRQRSVAGGGAGVELFVRRDDVLHDAVAHHVAAADRWTKARPSMPVEGALEADRGPLRPPGTSTWVVSPVTTALEPKPMRVRNIFICSGVVFWASSRMMKLSLSVRPRMNASGATSTVPRSSRRWTPSSSTMS